MNLFFYIILYWNILNTVLSLEYQKNQDIVNSEKSNENSLQDITDLSILQNQIENSDKLIIIFHAEWCGHCKHLLPKYELASTYKIAKDFSLLKVNCANKEICNHYDIKKFPTTKVYLKGKLMASDPGRELEDILEYIDKLQSPNIKLLQSLVEANEFSANYGDVSFILFDHNNDTDSYECLDKLAGDKFKSDFYFGYVPLEFANRNTSEMQTPRIQVKLYYL